MNFKCINFSLQRIVLFSDHLHNFYLLAGKITVVLQMEFDSIVEPIFLLKVLLLITLNCV